ncbi:MFS-type transporter SLC18B1 isoform X2 [Eurytemora carolleeae]|uniref:MFS-type transporter SLC18B1 isoform X2 n=1 Tax=Eurytemora carolleeae TaxID=1294199 RepID=UPI000C7949E1|nr:MFS-type transporter SLC18B1 isoform X2 [Eurytemora carolleeae]|eukprot:XP_023326779.1 MFS-type transporter SLC18B1-like isoform X2 [Eurytemora affinis]
MAHNRMKYKNIFNFLTVCTGNFMAAASYTIANPIYPSEALARGVIVSNTGVVLGSAYVTASLITPFCCKLISKWGAKKVYAFGSMVGGAGNILFGLLDYIHGPVEFFWLSLLFRTISSFGEAVVLNSSYPIGTKQFSENHRGKVVAFLDCCFGFGTAAGPSIGSLLFYASKGFLAPFLSIGIIMILLGGLMLSQDLKNEEQDTQSNEILKWTDILNCPGISANIVVLVFGSPATKWVAASSEPHFIELYGMTSVDVGLALTGNAIAIALTHPIVGVLLDYGLSSIFLIFVGNALVVLGLIGIGPFPGLQALQTIPMAVFSLVLIGMGIATIILATFSNMMECAKRAEIPDSEQATSMITSLWLLGNYVGAFLSSIAGGLTFDLIGFSWSCTLLASIITVAACGSLISSIISRKKWASYQQF